MGRGTGRAFLANRELAVRRRYSDAERAYLGVKRLVERGAKDAAERFIDEHASTLADYAELKEVAAMLDAATAARQEVGTAAGVSAAKKREILTEISRALDGLLRN